MDSRMWARNLENPCRKGIASRLKVARTADSWRKGVVVELKIAETADPWRKGVVVELKIAESADSLPEGLVLERPLLERHSEVGEIACRRPACKVRVLLCQSESSPRFAVDCEPLEMLSPFTPPPTPILEGAGHLVVD